MKSNLKFKINKPMVNAQREGGALAKNSVEKFPSAENEVRPVVSFVMVSKIKLCFRECASIVKVAEDTACFVEIASGTKSGDSDSILSLVNLTITAGQSLVLKIHGEKNREAFNRISKILNGESEAIENELES